MTLQAFIASHGVAVVSASETAITVCAGWTQGTRSGWRLETLPADWRAVREWLGY